MTIMIPAWIDGTLTPVEKLDAHLRGLRHKAISVFAMSGDHILIQQRAMCKYHTPGLWANTCCTHPDWDEAPLACAARRMNEELGITNLTLHHRGQLEYRADVGGGLIEHEVVEVYVAQVPFSLRMAPNPEEVMATRWVSQTDLRAQLKTTPDAFTPWLQIYMAQHSTMIFKEMAGA
ncbi:MAG: isopentenyl-diphosphate Delta-isomerase [Tateyamaria sp.]|jgi:isopentenyl-diphosphate delta-isomerase|uniref:isopentenyl-diphosphate Delta-isomerase n=1 Tax=unclassified Tateyamaria TaxID=2645127 RepID=UPI000D55C488|nr:isopentenyl-diphosphate Delta-isomerase [Tateyamaria sp. Alg231-49]